MCERALQYFLYTMKQTIYRKLLSLRGTDLIYFVEHVRIQEMCILGSIVTIFCNTIYNFIHELFNLKKRLVMHLCVCFLIFVLQTKMPFYDRSTTLSSCDRPKHQCNSQILRRVQLFEYITTCLLCTYMLSDQSI